MKAKEKASAAGAKTSASDSHGSPSYFKNLVKHLFARGQAGVEFMAIVAFLALLLTIIYIVTYSQQSQALAETSVSSGWAVCQQIASEVSAAVSVGGGYERVFYLPQKVNGEAYTISIYTIEQAVHVSWHGYSCRSPLVTSQISGTPRAGSNKVANNNGNIVFS